MGSYCEQSPIVCPKSIPKYKYLSALGVRVFVNAVGFCLTCMSKMDGVCTLPVCQLSDFLLPTFKGLPANWSPYYQVSWGSDHSSSIRYWSPIVWLFSLNLGRCIYTTASRVAYFSQHLVRLSPAELSV